MGWIADAEGSCLALYASAKIEPDEPQGPAELARRIIGRRCIRYVDGSRLRGDGALARVGEEWFIYLRRKLSPEREAFAIAHELAEYHLRELRDEAIEDRADLLAATLIAPRSAFAAVLQALGEDLPAIAETFVCSESFAALRIGETTGRPMALIAPARVRVRGDEWGWPESESGMRRLARGSHPSVRAKRLGDDPRRVVLTGLEAA